MRGKLQVNKPGSERIMSLYSSDTSDEQHRLRSVSEPAVDDGKLEGSLGCDTRSARTTAK
jgi:hypothetical protein